MNTRMLGTVCLVLAMTASAWADPVTLQAPALLDRPGVVAVDARNVTTIQFCDQIIWSAFKAAWLHATVAAQDKRVLLLDASAGSGEASMHVWVEGEGRPLQFLIRASGNTLANHLYFVGCAHPPQQTALSSPRTLAPVPDPTARQATPPVGSGRALTNGQPDPSASAGLSAVKGWDEFVAGLSSRQRALLDALTAHPSADPYAAFTESLTKDQAAAWARLAPAAHLVPPDTPASRTISGRWDPGSPYRALPAWAALQITATPTLAGLVISYKLANTGKATLVLDPARLQVLGADWASVSKFSLSRQTTGGLEGRVPPGQVESGVIWIPESSPGNVLVRWPVVEIGTGTVYAINHRFL